MRFIYLLAALAVLAVVDATYFDGKYISAAHSEIVYLFRGY
jgi:hypothetical protein